MVAKTYKALESLHDIYDFVYKYEREYEKNNVVNSHQQQNALVDLINVVIRNRLFTADVLAKLKELFFGMRDTVNDYKKHLDATRKIRSFICDTHVELSPEEELEFFERIISKYNVIYNEYLREHKIQKDKLSDLVRELNIFMQANNKDTDLLYDKIKVPMYGLTSKTEKVVQGCMDDLKKIFDGFLRYFQLTVGQKEEKRTKNNNDYQGFGRYKSKKSLEQRIAESEDAELGLVIKHNKLRSAVEAVLDKRAKQQKVELVRHVVVDVNKKE